jgi:hypothetical protein
MPIARNLAFDLSGPVLVELAVPCYMANTIAYVTYGTRPIVTLIVSLSWRVSIPFVVWSLLLTLVLAMTMATFRFHKLSTPVGVEFTHEPSTT